MHSVGSGERNIDKEAAGQFTLDIKVVLLQISVLLDGVASCRKVVLRQNVLRHVRLRVAPRDRDQGARTILVERPLSGTSKIRGAAGRAQCTGVRIQRRTRA